MSGRGFSITRTAAGTYRLRYRDATGKVHSENFAKYRAAESEGIRQKASVNAGTHVAPREQRMTVRQYIEQRFLPAQESTSPASQRQAATHCRRIVKRFGSAQLAVLDASAILAWTAELRREGLGESTIYALYRRMAQVLNAAVRDRVIPTSPIYPGLGRKVRLLDKRRKGEGWHIPERHQVWALYEAFPDHLRPAVLLAAFAGLRVAEACGLHWADVDLDRGLINPTTQYPGIPLKTDASRAAVPIPAGLVDMLREFKEGYGHSDFVVSDGFDGGASPWSIQRAVRAHRSLMPPHFVFHDLRHYFASSLIASGADIQLVSSMVRHADATMTLRIYSHLFPSDDVRARAKAAEVFGVRPTEPPRALPPAV